MHRFRECKRFNDDKKNGTVKRRSEWHMNRQRNKKRKAQQERKESESAEVNVVDLDDEEDLFSFVTRISVVSNVTSRGWILNSVASKHID